MENQADNEKSAQKAKEMMGDENFELNLNALEAAAGGTDWEPMDTYEEEYEDYFRKQYGK